MFLHRPVPVRTQKKPPSMNTPADITNAVKMSRHCLSLLMCSERGSSGVLAEYMYLAEDRHHFSGTLQKR